MKKYFSAVALLSILIFSNLCVSSCSDREDTVSCFPQYPINVTINLNLPAYFDLNYVGGWKYINEQDAGSRGLIVVRSGSNSFKIYDRNAPHICPANNTTLEVVDNIKIICPKDNAEWILLTGQPTIISSVPPKTYPYQYNAGAQLLNIYY